MAKKLAIGYHREGKEKIRKSLAKDHAEQIKEANNG